MDIDSIGPKNRPGDPPGSPLFGEDAQEISAGATVFGLIGGITGLAAAGAAVVPIAVGATVGAGLYSLGCGIKFLWNKL